ncbi:MAG: hypothetical protein CVV27_14115 [Candidatus Melainabacteria bacterium HGW-Melainabacteria-1]|nr:MAG: hypothetical protein CVV27_14115 [Candidatus Melainabacteria bacterium HGW-Melainabacteria-1]
MRDQDKTLSIDKLLLEKGLITPEQLTVALQYQCRLPKGQEQSLAEVLVSLEYLSEDQLKAALGEKPPAEDVLVQMLIKDGMIEPNQLAEALRTREDRHEDKRMGTMLLEMGYTTREVIETALKHYYQKQHQAEPPAVQAPQAPPQTARSTGPLSEEHVPLGQRLIRKGVITAAELEHALDYQQRLPRILHKPIGEILIMLGYLSQQQLDGMLQERPPSSQLSLGDILVRSGVLQQWQLSHAMSLIDQPEHQGKKLGMLLMELGYARRPEIETALKEYYARQQARKASE